MRFLRPPDGRKCSIFIIFTMKIPKMTLFWREKYIFFFFWDFHEKIDRQRPVFNTNKLKKSL
jgi:hypothetical protein